MSRTLQITSILGAICVAAIVVIPAVFGSEKDQRLQQLLNTPSVVERFKQTAGSTRVSDDESPLVKQARAFALYLNPPPPPKPVRSSPPSRPTPRPVGPVSAKFELLGTSYHPLRPELSLALIDEPGKGLRWVKPSTQVGHLVIEQIKDGVIVVRDGERTFEIVAERPERVSLLKTDKKDKIKDKITEEHKAPITPRRTTTARTPARTIADRNASRRTRQEPPPPSPEEIALLERFMKETEGITDEQELAKKAAEILGLEIPESEQNSRITDDEAKQLEKLGEQLNDANNK